MSPSLLAVLVLGPTAVVVAAFFVVLWHERTSLRESRIALASGCALAMWAVVATVLAYRGFFRPPDAASAPPVGINLAVALFVLTVCLAASASLREAQDRKSTRLNSS